MTENQAQLRRVRVKLKQLYKELGSWRAVAKVVGVSHVYVYDVAKKKKPLPRDQALRAKFLELIQEAKAMNAEQAKLVHLLETFHLGRQHAVTMRELLREMYGPKAVEDLSKNNLYDRELRAMIETVNHEHGGLICSNPSAGYWWAGTLEEGLACVALARHRGQSIMDNASHLEVNLKRAFGGQLTLIQKGGA